MSTYLMLLCACALAAPTVVPSSWRVLPIPRCVDYGDPDDFVVLGKVAIVRREGGPYRTVRDAADELVGKSTITEEELTAILRQHGVASVESVPDDLASYDGYDTLIALGPPRYNTVTAKCVGVLKRPFDRWDDPNTPEDDFQEWADLGTDGYFLKAGHNGKQGIVLLAGHDRDDATA